jgi:hypothetical protein
MPTERCWGCKEMKLGVTLRSTDDRLCPDCFDENERQLCLMKQQQRQPATLASDVLAVNRLSDQSSSSATAACSVESASNVAKSRKKPAKRAALTSVVPSTDILINDQRHLRQTDARSVARSTTGDDPLVPTDQPSSVRVTVLDDDVLHDNNAALEAQSEIVHLKFEVCRLAGLVDSLSTKLNFVLSFLQLSDDLASVPQPIGSITGGSATTASNVSNQLYSTVLKANGKPTNFREAAVTAVYVDQGQKDSRKNSVIVSGLPVRTCSDKSSVTKLFKDEFDLDTDISVCKRLGQKFSGKVQPLLVTLRNSEHVHRILSDAKRLRHSHDLLVRNQVY